MNLIVVGKPGSGKTSWCAEYTDWLRKQSLSVGGILSPEVREDGRRVGFNVIDLLTGESESFAELSAEGLIRGGEAVGAYTISKDGISFARRAIERGVEDRCDLVVIDEVGLLELRGKGLMPAVELTLASAVNTLIVVRTSLIGALQKHCHIEHVQVHVQAEDISGSPRRRIVCDECGERINDYREVTVAGKVCCRSCAYRACYQHRDTSFRGIRESDGVESDYRRYCEEPSSLGKLITV